MDLARSDANASSVFPLQWRSSAMACSLSNPAATILWIDSSGKGAGSEEGLEAGKEKDVIKERGVEDGRVRVTWDQLTGSLLLFITTLGMLPLGSCNDRSHLPIFLFHDHTLTITM